MTRTWQVPTLVLVFATACGGSGQIGVDGAAAVDAPIDAGPAAIQLRFDRPAGGHDFDAIAAWVDASGQPIAGPAIVIGVDHGSIAPATIDGFESRARVTPGDGVTGLFEVTAAGGADVSVVRTAVVLDTVDDAWNQPELVRGLVNTPGWEDGESISPDGQTLILQYLPVAINCLAAGEGSNDANSADCRIIGPTAAPERPGMPGANRVKADGTFDNGCPSLGLDPLPPTIVVPPNSEWAFTRQADGSFADPRPVFYDGADGCFSSFGLMIGPDGKTATWAFDSPLPGGTGPKLRTGVLDLSGPTVLGLFGEDAGNITLSAQPGAALDFGEALPEGNPYLATLADGRRLVLFDDETGRQDLMFTQETAPGSNTWSAVAVIPDPVSAAGPQESQPFLDGQTLLFRRDLVVLASDWSGGAMDDAASWSAARTILAPGAAATGAVIVVGEPSVATTATGRELYFVYGEQLASGSLDLGVATVPAR